MAFNFPDPSVTTEVYNVVTGTTYNWVTPPGKWVVVSTAMADDFIQDIEDLTTETERQKDIDDAMQLEIDQLKISVEELEITKGSVARYTVEGIGMSIATRDGEIYFNDANAELVTFMSFAPFDLDGRPTRPIEAGDIVEIDTPTVIARYTAVNGSSSTLTVVYAGGADGETIAVGDTYEYYTYPHNTGSASKDYVDAADGLLQDQINDTKGDLITLDNEKVSKSGDTVTGRLDFAKIRGDSPGNSIVIKGRIGPDGDTHEGVIFKDFQQPDYSVVADYINYNGRIHAAENIVNKGYVDSQVDDALNGLGSTYLRLTGGTLSGDLHCSEKLIMNDGGHIDIARHNAEGDKVTLQVRGRIVENGPTSGTMLKSVNFGSNKITDGVAPVDYVEYHGDVNRSKSVQTKASTLTLIQQNATNSYVEDYNGANPPANRARGTLLITTSNALYLYI